MIVVDVYSNYSLAPVDNLRIQITVINNLDNDPTTTTISQTTTRQSQISTQQPSTDSGTIIAQSDTQAVTPTKPPTNIPIVCPMLACQEGCVC